MEGHKLQQKERRWEKSDQQSTKNRKRKNKAKRSASNKKTELDNLIGAVRCSLLNVTHIKMAPAKQLEFPIHTGTITARSKSDQSTTVASRSFAAAEGRA
jgi:hypothetical protein